MLLTVAQETLPLHPLGESLKRDDDLACRDGLGHDEPHVRASEVQRGHKVVGARLRPLWTVAPMFSGAITCYGVPRLQPFRWAHSRGSPPHPDMSFHAGASALQDLILSRLSPRPPAPHSQQATCAQQ